MNRERMHRAACLLSPCDRCDQYDRNNPSDNDTPSPVDGAPESVYFGSTPGAGVER